MWRKREPLTPRTTLELSHCNHVQKRQLPSPEPKERSRTLFKPPPRDVLLGDSPLNSRGRGGLGERDLLQKRPRPRSSPGRRRGAAGERKAPAAVRLVGPALDDLRVKVEEILAEQEKISGEVTRLEGKITLQDVESITSNLLDSVGASRAKWEFYRRSTDRLPGRGSGHGDGRGVDGAGYPLPRSPSREQELERSLKKGKTGKLKSRNRITKTTAATRLRQRKRTSRVFARISTCFCTCDLCTRLRSCSRIHSTLTTSPVRRSEED